VRDRNWSAVDQYFAGELIPADPALDGLRLTNAGGPAVVSPSLLLKSLATLLLCVALDLRLYMLLANNDCAFNSHRLVHRAQVAGRAPHRHFDGGRTDDAHNLAISVKALDNFLSAISES
jgi:hypothetical protein